MWDYGDGLTENIDYRDVTHTYSNLTENPVTFTISLKILTSGTHCFITKKDSALINSWRLLKQSK